MRKLVCLVAVFYVGMAVMLSFGLGRVPLLADFSSSEVVHVVAHMAMYGGLALLVRRALLVSGGGAGPLTAAAITLGVASAQELAQVISFGRMPGAPELFDLAVDATAIAIALTAHRWFERVREKLSRVPRKRPAAVDVRRA